MTLESFSLRGRVALVTGARSGIGQAFAVALAGAGADIVGVGRNPSPETAAAVRSAGSRYVDVSADLAEVDGGGAAELVARARDEFGGLDVLVNNAGQIHRSPALDAHLDTWNHVLGLNLTVPFLLAQAFGRAVLENPPRASNAKIVNIASLLSFQGGINTASYTASKSGLVGLTHLLCNEWAARGINVNAVAPGYIDTDATAALRADPDRSAQILQRIPAGRWGRPEDLAGAATFLASSASDYVNGIVLPVDGGWLAR